eukprot:3788595-Pyramimonas_sp.AAC.1
MRQDGAFEGPSREAAALGAQGRLMAKEADRGQRLCTPQIVQRAADSPTGALRTSACAESRDGREARAGGGFGMSAATGLAVLPG